MPDADAVATARASEYVERLVAGVDGERFARVPLFVPVDCVPVLVEAFDLLDKRLRLHDDPKIAAGQAVELLCANFLAGPG